MTKETNLSDKIGQILSEINGKKEILTRTQKELEHKINDLDKLLDIVKKNFNLNLITHLKPKQNETKKRLQNTFKKSRSRGKRKATYTVSRGGVRL